MTTDSHDSNPARLAHSLQPPLARMLERRERNWTFWLLAWTGLFALSRLLDGVVGSGLAFLRRGDVERELAALGQWGQLSSLVIVGVILICMQPQRWRRLLDLAVAAGLTSLICLLLKTGLGRMRPRLEEPYGFDGILMHTGGAGASTRLEEFTHYDLASFPSSHTAAAMVFSLFIAMLWPRLWGLALVMVLVVGVSRFAFAAHWGSDVLAGATIGLLVGYPAIRWFWGVRLCDWLWKTLVDRRAVPALGAVVSTERGYLERPA
ncbi:MAG: phosphatase PAP2 family protein [Planctomycetota bacterium]|nr:phosphatase PAP2 family protein [Planctomycetota bacterium]